MIWAIDRQQSRSACDHSLSQPFTRPALHPPSTVYMFFGLFHSRAVHVVLLALLLSAATPLAGAQPTSDGSGAQVSASGQRIVEATRAQLLQVRTLLKGQDSQASVGSGFLVDTTGLAITNYHVVSQYALRPSAYRLSYTMAEGRSGSLALLAFDAIRDVALVRLTADPSGPDADKPTPHSFLPLSFRPNSQPLAKGERLYSLGNPLDVGFAVVEGIYNGLVERSYLPNIFFGGSLNPGMSGGPAVDSVGRVIGVNVATRRDGEQVSFLVPAQHAQALIERSRNAAPITAPAHEEVTRQLLAHQAAMVDRFIAQPWRSANHARYMVPVPQETFMRCWGTPSPPNAKHFKFERSDCAMDHGVFISPRLLTGAIKVRHEAYDGSNLGALRFSHMYSASFRNESFWTGPDATPPRCRERFIDRDGLVLRTVACLSALKRLEGLFNLSVLVTTVDHATQGVQGRLDALGVSFDNALRLTEHYLNGFNWRQGAATDKPAAGVAQ